MMKTKKKKKTETMIRLAGRIILVVLLLPMLATTACARLLKSIGKTLDSQEQSFTIGSGLDYQKDDEETEYDLSLVLEYGFLDNLTIASEPNYIHLARVEDTNASGFGELEVSLSYNILEAEDRHPGLSSLALVKLPTASSEELGTGGTDLTLGLSISQDFGKADADISALYTFVGSPPGATLQNSIEFILAGEWYASDLISLVVEAAAIDGAGRSHAQSGSIQGLAGREGGSERSLTFGVTEHLSDEFKLEQGIVYVLDGTVQAVLAWEWTIGD